MAAVLDLDELLLRIPRLIARLTSFTVFSVYLLDERRQDLRKEVKLGWKQTDRARNRRT